jgi:hypothetical protein
MNQPIPFVDIMGGVNMTLPPHLVPPNQWSFLQGMRPFRGGLKQIELEVLKSASGTIPHQIVSISTGKMNQCLLISVGHNGVKRYIPDSTLTSMTCKEYGTNTTVTLTGSATSNVPSVCMYNNQAWIVSPFWQLMFTDGTRLQKYPGEQPKARFVEAFFDHLVVANTTYKGERCPTRVMWSDLYRPDMFDPSKTNEADFYDLSEWSSQNESNFEITGMHRIGDVLFYFLPCGIVSTQYVGLPKVFRIDAVPGTEGIGSTFPYALGKARNMCFFYCDREKNFFSFDGQQIQQIGDPIIEWFLGIANFSGFYSLELNFRAFTVPRYNEIWWYFRGTDAKPYYLVYNWETKTWFHTNYGSGSRFIHGFFAARGTRALTCDELTATCDEQSDVCDALSTGSATPLRSMFFGSALNLVEQSTDTYDTLFSSFNSDYIMITGDRFYGNLETKKECSSIVINAQYTSGSGIEVYVSVRDQLNDTVSWVDLGTWTTATPFRQLTFPPIQGKIFRWKFVALPPPPNQFVRGFQLLGFQENINMRKAVK